MLVLVQHPLLQRHSCPANSSKKYSYKPQGLGQETLLAVKGKLLQIAESVTRGEVANALLGSLGNALCSWELGTQQDLACYLLSNVQREKKICFYPASFSSTNHKALHKSSLASFLWCWSCRGEVVVAESSRVTVRMFGAGLGREFSSLCSLSQSLNYRT